MSDTRPRLERILELYGQTLSEAIGKREPMSYEACLSNRDIILRFADMDPTDGKSRTQWLVKTYIADTHFKLEDLGRVDAALAAFERFKRKLPRAQRELSRFNKLRELEALVDPFVKAESKARIARDLSSATGRELRRLEEWKAWDESIIIQEGQGLPTIAVPMTEFASKWWGRGTQWCTAAEKDNAFQEYHRDAPLIVIVCPDGSKFQMYVMPYLFQFMDNTDKTVDDDTIQARWSEFQSLFYWAIQQNREVFKNTPKDLRNPEFCRLAIEQNGRALEYMPDEHRTPELCRIAVEQHGMSLKYVPSKHITLELCLLAIEQNGHALHIVPEKYKTPELFCMAIKRTGQALAYISEDQRTPELCRIAVEQDGTALHAVPVKHITDEICRISVKKRGQALIYVPKDKNTLEICRLAIEQDGQALYAISENKRTLELCRLAVEQNGDALQFVPEIHTTAEICGIAVEQDGDALRWVPEKHKTPELMALVSPARSKWHPEILQELGNQSKHIQVSKISV
jgi:Domain of unknown function (DUF4116)